MVNTITLYRPVGQKELDLIASLEFCGFPPRLPEQPIFYPVLNEGYATQIARDWNARLNTDRVGYVTRFKIERQFIEKYDRHVVGGSVHEEYWIQSEDMDKFNQNLVGEIEIVSKFENVE